MSHDTCQSFVQILKLDFEINHNKCRHVLLNLLKHLGKHNFTLICLKQWKVSHLSKRIEHCSTWKRVGIKKWLWKFCSLWVSSSFAEPELNWEQLGWPQWNFNSPKIWGTQCDSHTRDWKWIFYLCGWRGDIDKSIPFLWLFCNMYILYLISARMCFQPGNKILLCMYVQKETVRATSSLWR